MDGSEQRKGLDGETHAYITIRKGVAGCRFYHLHGADVLLLLHVDVSQVEPDVADVGGGLPHLGEHVSRLPEVALVGQDGTCTQREDPSATRDAGHVGEYPSLSIQRVVGRYG